MFRLKSIPIAIGAISRSAVQSRSSGLSPLEAIQTYRAQIAISPSPISLWIMSFFCRSFGSIAPPYHIFTLRFHGLVTVYRFLDKPHYGRPQWLPPHLTPPKFPSCQRRTNVIYRPKTLCPCAFGNRRYGRSDNSGCSVPAAPLYEDIRAGRIADDGHTATATGDMLSILIEKPHPCAGLPHNIGHSFTKNIIRHDGNHPFGNFDM